MGVRKLDPERQKQNSHNFLEWVRAPGEDSSENLLTVYQTSFVADQTPGNEGSCARRYPKHHTQKQCAAQKDCSCSKPAPEDEKALQPYQPSS